MALDFDTWVANARAVSIESEIARRRIVLRAVGRERLGPCPKCGGNDRFSVNVAEGVWNCRGCKPEDIPGDVIGLVEFLDDVDFLHAVEVLTHEPPPAGNGAARVRLGPPVAIYDYVDEAGRLLFQVTRHAEPEKTFRQRRPDGAGGWIADTDGVRMVPYRLPSLIAALAGDRTVFVVEGEKDVDNLIRIGVPATCNPRGAGKWANCNIDSFFVGADVVIIADNDAQARNKKTQALLFHTDGRPRFVGWDHAHTVAAHLSPLAKRVRLIDLKKAWPACPEKGDISDWLADGGGTRDALLALADSLRPWMAGDMLTLPAIAGPAVITGGAKVLPFPEQWRRPGFIATEHAVADVFATLHRDAFAYSAARKIWRQYDSVRWIDDPGSLALWRAFSPLLADIEEDVRKPRERQMLGSSRFRSGIERELRSLLCVDEERFDADPWLLNCPSGTLDLRAGGVMRPHSPHDYITKVTAVDPAGECHDWQTFLDWMTCLGEEAEENEFADYLQRLAGYAITGVADEQMLAFLYGTGANGKTVFMQTLLRVLGDYAVSVPGEVFLISQYERHPEEMMRMRGARLIVASEVPINAQWNEARIKAVTGGEQVMARFMRENTVEFTSTGTLLIAGNHKPALRGMDEGVKRRFQIIPCRAKVETRDKHLGETLMGEAAGILQWMVDGCRAWQQQGLAPPPVVVDETAEYIADQDHLAQWVSECCTDHRTVVGSTISEKIGTLYASWRKWAESSGVYPGSINPFSTNLRNMGFERMASQKQGRRIKWITLRPKDDEGGELPNM